MIFDIVLYSMIVLAVIVFIALFFFKAGYGYLGGGKWGPQLDNKAAWVIMEAPAFIVMAAMLARYLTAGGDPGGNTVAVCVMAAFYLLHYFQRSFIFPFLMNGHGKMPAAIMLMGVVFNCINAWLLGEWFFVQCPSGAYAGWMHGSYFIVGTIIFFIGMGINLHSDHIIRHLRKPGDTRHYIPVKGLYKYVTSANYFGELVEWCGYAILTMSPAAFVFAIWTAANLAPRSKALTNKYIQEFGDEYTKLGKKNLIPFIW